MLHKHNDPPAICTLISIPETLKKYNQVDSKN